MVLIVPLVVLIVPLVVLIVPLVVLIVPFRNLILFYCLEYLTCFQCGHTRLRKSTRKGNRKIAPHDCDNPSALDDQSSYSFKSLSRSDGPK